MGAHAQAQAQARAQAQAQKQAHAQAQAQARTFLKTAARRTVSTFVMGCRKALLNLSRSLGGSRMREHVLQMHCSTATVCFR